MNIASIQPAFFPLPRENTDLGHPARRNADFNQRLQEQMAGSTGAGMYGSMIQPGSYVLPMQNSSGTGEFGSSINGRVSPYSASYRQGALPANIQWPGGQDLSRWKQSVQIKVNGIENGRISWEETGDRANWPAPNGANANVWIIREASPGRYTAETWEYLGPTMTSKEIQPIIDGIKPRSGERVGIMVAGITRNPAERNIEARSNIDWITWP